MVAIPRRSNAAANPENHAPSLIGRPSFPPCLPPKTSYRNTTSQTSEVEGTAPPSCSDSTTLAPFNATRHDDCLFESVLECRDRVFNRLQARRLINFIGLFKSGILPKGAIAATRLLKARATGRRMRSLHFVRAFWITSSQSSRTREKTSLSSAAERGTNLRGGGGGEGCHYVTEAFRVESGGACWVR